MGEVNDISFLEGGGEGVEEVNDLSPLEGGGGGGGGEG